MTFTDNKIMFSNAKYEKLTGRRWIFYKHTAMSSRRQTENSIYCMCSLVRRAEMMKIYILVVVLITELSAFVKTHYICILQCMEILHENENKLNM